MKIRQQLGTIILGLCFVGALGACSGMSTQSRNTAIGAGVGGVAGAILTDGNALGTVGGAAVGGLIGNQAK